PRTNGKAERFIQTALREWAYGRAYDNSGLRAAELSTWLHQYNRRRPHASLDHAPPISRAGLDRNNLLSHHTQILRGLEATQDDSLRSQLTGRVTSSNTLLAHYRQSSSALIMHC